jgi:regulator of protease activity HflC (stomatin/prohibitin superfamily)
MIVTFLTILSCIGLIYGVLSFFKFGFDQRGNKLGFKLPYGKRVLVPSAVFLLLLIVFNTFLCDLTAQEVGVVVTPSGVRSEVLTTGWNFVSPWNTVKKMDKTVWVYTLTSNKQEGAKDKNDAIWAPTIDGIKMGFDISVNWRIDPKQAPWIYSNIVADEIEGGRYAWIEENIIRPAIKSVMPLTISQYTPIECYSEKRTEIQRKVEESLRKELKSNKLIVDVVQIRDVHYLPAYEESINQKKLAEQQVLTMVQVTRQKEEELKQAHINKNIAIEKAEGEAKSLQIKGESINKNPRIIQLEWINKWNGELPVYQMGSGTTTMVNLGNLSKE